MLDLHIFFLNFDDFFEFYCRTLFNLDEEFNETIKSRHRDDFNYHSFSEGEKLRIDLAILFTWREIAKLKNSTNTNLLILDEIFDSSLDTSGTDEFMRILYHTMNKENVFVIARHSRNPCNGKTTNIPFLFNQILIRPHSEKARYIF